MGRASSTRTWRWPDPQSSRTMSRGALALLSSARRQRRITGLHPCRGSRTPPAELLQHVPEVHEVVDLHAEHLLVEPVAEELPQVVSATASAATCRSGRCSSSLATSPASDATSSTGSPRGIRPYRMVCRPLPSPSWSVTVPHHAMRKLRATGRFAAPL